MGGARPALAQSAHDGVYVSVSAFVDIKRFSGDPATNVLDGQAFGGGIALGTSLAPRWDLELGVDVPAVTTDLHPRSVTLRRSIFTLQSRTRNRPSSVTALIRFRGAQRGRVQIGYFGGLSLLRLHRQFDTEAPAGTPAALIPRPHESVDYGTAPAIGVDARVDVNAHLSIVPALYLSAFSLQDVSGVLVRPRVAIRWTF